MARPKSRGEVHDDAVMFIVTAPAAGTGPQDAWSGRPAVAKS